jgi:hypothetical protein
VLDGVLGLGACAGGCSDCVDVLVEPAAPEGCFEALLALLPAASAGEVSIVLPGNAWAATADSTPASVMLAAISQRLMRRSWPSAASRV